MTEECEEKIMDACYYTGYMMGWAVRQIVGTPFSIAKVGKKVGKRLL